MRVVAIAMLLAGVSPAGAQVVEYKAGAVTAYPHAESNNEFLKKVRWGRDPASALALYAGVYRGASGALDSISVDATAQAFAVRFPTLHFVISAAARIQSEVGEAALGNHLRRLNAHIRLTPLDSSRNVIADESALEVIAILPNSIDGHAPADTSHVKAKVTLGSVLAQAYAPNVLGALGARAVSILGQFHNSGLKLTAPTQVSYLSASTEFGWTWYEHEDKSIEGIHRTAVLIQAAPNVRYVRAYIELITDWKFHGTWMKPFDVIVDVGNSSSATAVTAK
jgi:hypothetical protein